MLHVCACACKCMRVYKRVTIGGFKACVGPHVSVCICVYKCMRVRLCVTHTHTNGGLKVGMYSVLIGIHA